MTQDHDASVEKFALGRGMWAMTAVIYSFFTLLSAFVITDSLTTSERAGRVFDVVWVGGIALTGAWILLGEPRRVEVLDDGLRFVAPARVVVIPWASLTSVSSPTLDLNRTSLHWKFGRRKVHTWGPYDRQLEELLALIGKHAPFADVRRAVTRRPTWGLRPRTQRR